MYYMFVFYVPETDAESVTNAVFAAGGGRLGNYDRCCWQTPGTGQFRPLTGSEPAIGDIGDDTRVAEIKVEMICVEEVLPAVIEALLTAHPYETPAFSYWPVATSA